MSNIDLRSEPFLWIHLAGVVLFPLFLAVSIIGFGIGDSYPYVLELVLAIAIGILPVLVMQWVRPFNIFSVLFLSLKPESLSEDRRVILSLFKTWKQKLMSAIAGGIMVVVLWLLYRLSPLAVGLTDFFPHLRVLGLSIATVAFLASNLFLQVPLSVLLVLRTKKSKLERVESYPSEQIEQDFTTPGIKIDRILWFLKPPPNAATEGENL